MSITVENMLKIKSFSDFKILAGHDGIKRKIRSVTVMEAPDMYKWLKGGEFFITTGYWMKYVPNEIEELIIKIENSGASAFGIKLNRFIDALPDKVLEIANNLSFPIIQIPSYCAFIDIINPVLSLIINEQALRLKHSENIHKSFTSLVINGGNTHQIIDTLGNILKIDVAFYDTYFEKKYINSHSDTFSKFFNDIETLEIATTLLLYDHYPINIDKKNYGYIIISNETIKNKYISEYNKIVIEHASTVLKLDIQKKISNMQIEEKYRNEFVRDLITNNIKTIEEVKNRSKLYNWNFDTGIISVIVDIDNFKIHYLKIKDKKMNYSLESTKLIVFKSAIKILKQYFKEVPYTTFNDSLVLLIKPIYEDKLKFFNKLKEICKEINANILKKTNFTATIGTGNYEPSVMNSYISYKNAQMAVKLGRIIYKCNKVISYDELGVYKLLSLIYTSNEAKEFYLSNLYKLIDHDKKNNADLLNTLYNLVKNNWNLRVTSKKMYVHYNTIKYRFNKINELLNVDLRNSEERINIIISLKLMEMVE